MGKGLKESKRKRRGFRGAAVLLFAVCIIVGGLPVPGYAGPGAGTAGGKPEEYTDAGNLQGGPSEESQDIVRGFGNKIKDKKQKEIKVRVNHGNQGNRNGKSWNLQMIQAGNVNAGEAEGSGRKIKVAVIDSGINFNTDLPVAARKNFIPGEERSVLYEDMSGHGTAVAGIIAALDNDEGITGINPRVELYSARVLDENLEAPAGRIAEAIDWAVEQDVDIVNMSFGIAKNVKELEEAVGRASEAGILLVAAAGNGETVVYPAAYNEVIAVGSVTAEGLAAEDSAGGEALELMAPGEDILSSAIFGGVTGVSGTSMAAPHVAGVASVLMERNPEMPADYIRMLLNYSANLYGSPDEYGNGVLDLGYALEINDKFKKLYEKHIDKAEKNKKEKQKEKFWGEVLKTIPENEKAVETFPGTEVVGGLWLKDNRDHVGKLHENFVITGVEGSQVISFTGEQMKILKYACGYPDATKGGLNAEGKPYHGHLWQYKIYPVNGKDRYVPVAEANYVANYILLTRIADVFGSVPSFAGNNTQLVKSALEALFQEAEAYMYAGDLTHMRGDFGSVTKLGERTWQQVFGDMGGTVEVTPENVKFFIYGMALHSITDTYAHSTFSKKGTQWGRVGHNDDDFSISCDNDTYIPERWTAAQYAADSVLTKLGCGLKGDLLDFVSPSSFQYGTFYLGNLSAYAQMTDAVQYPWAKGLLKRGDLWFNVQDETKIKYDGKFENGSVSHKTRPVLKASEY